MKVAQVRPLDDEARDGVLQHEVARLVVGERTGDQVRLVELGGRGIVGGGQHEGARLGRDVLEALTLDDGRLGAQPLRADTQDVVVLQREAGIHRGGVDRSAGHLEAEGGHVGQRTQDRDVRSGLTADGQLPSGDQDQRADKVASGHGPLLQYQYEFAVCRAALSLLVGSTKNQ
jgi:hypothetical protein